MRWSEEQLEAHLKAHRNKVNLSKERLKRENDAKVRQARMNDLKRTTTQNTNTEGKLVLSCEIATCPPSVNHYWVAKGKKRFLSDKAKMFHALVRVLVPPKQTEARLKLDVTFHFPNHQTRDIDNYLKATIDSLVKCGLCVDDEQFDELIVKRGQVVKGGLIKIKVLEL
ncbi:RusA family crossover junction endodeoxyribonuclease [Acinetobacter haemolyticus]|uniref:RusA family crossover junction endodeoxyribonuclease n=1 Tax=Acinetobacter haemolyticus TaxID=29430 RepID=UPI0024DE5AB4|nr:RusA family crossover junction endodeoxyribonuclease [Acinetobacter haemolyticus]